MILHGSRSGVHHIIDSEFNSLSNYGEITQLAFNASIGEDKYSIHLIANHWGWNARGCSSKYLAVEFAQGFVGGQVNDAMVRAFCIWFRDVARKQWPHLPANFPSHAELDGTPEYGPYDGKSDIFPEHDTRMVDLRMRIAAHMDFFNIPLDL